MKQVGFRARLFLILLGFALIPTIVLSVAWELTVVRALPLLGTIPAMERIAETSGARSRQGGAHRSIRHSAGHSTSINTRSRTGCSMRGRWSSS